jgi:energy-coupling factor transporter transmembrane protein EcfT
MTKKPGMILFMLAATVFNIVITILCFLILMLIYTVFVVPHIPDNVSSYGFPIIFLASFFISFLAYQKALKLYLKKHPMKDREINNRQT